MMKKGQFGSMSIVVGLAMTFVLIMMFVGIHYSISLSGTSAESMKKLEGDAVKIATSVSNMPELVCTKNNVVTANCINTLNAEKFGGISNNKYFNMLGFSTIKIYDIDGTQKIQGPIYDRNIPGYKNKISITLPRLIYDPTEPTGNRNCFALGKGSCNYGYITIEMFAR